MWRGRRGGHLKECVTLECVTPTHNHPHSRLPLPGTPFMRLGGNIDLSSQLMIYETPNQLWILIMCGQKKHEIMQNDTSNQVLSSHSKIDMDGGLSRTHTKLLTFVLRQWTLYLNCCKMEGFEKNWLNLVKINHLIRNKLSHATYLKPRILI